MTDPNSKAERIALLEEQRAHVLAYGGGQGRFIKAQEITARIEAIEEEP
ncbi:MAG: hypothetical protein KGI89_02985 [Euryarchaeota archaeon]|nr:hypothetical protein [Euryarchaeota archaeon]